MKAILLQLAAVLVMLSMVRETCALEPNLNEETAVGGYLAMGTATVLGDGYADLNGIDQDKSLSYSAGGGLYIDHYFNEWFGVEAGIGFLGKGARYKGSVLGEDWRMRLRFVYMEIPIALKLNIDRRFQITAGIALWVALTGKEVGNAGSVSVENKFDSDEDWAPYHRANVGPKLSFAYAIPVGPVNIVPGLTWMMHLINDIDTATADHTMREMNIMLQVGVDWFFR